MTPEQLEQQSREAVIAYLQDSSVRLEFKMKCNEKWLPVLTVGYFNFANYYYRILQPKPWYRVALFKSRTMSVDNEEEEEYYRQSLNFIKWLTERIEYSYEDNKSIED